MSVLSLNVFNTSAGFGFVPLLVILLWPRRANGPISVAGVFIAGLFTDWATGGVLGQWALIYVLGFALLRPEIRNMPFAFLRALLAWFVLAGLAAVLLYASGQFVFGVPADVVAILRQILLATAILPFLLIIRNRLAGATGSSEQWGR
jgi:cell shape-determining protein MreD